MPVGFQRQSSFSLIKETARTASYDDKDVNSRSSMSFQDAEGNVIDPAQAGSFQELLHMFGGERGVRQMVLGVGGPTKTVDETANFRRDVDKLRKHLRDQRRGLLNPRGRFVQYWDMVTCFALMFTLFVTPYEVGMDLTTRLDGLFIVNQLVALVFMCDICIQFFLPTRTTAAHGEYERSHWRLAKNYGKSWLFVDVMSVIPFDILVLAGAMTGPVKIIKLLRVLRLLKLVKVLRASSIIERWESAFAIPSATMSLASWSFGAFVALHWFACGWALLAQLTPSQRGDMGSDVQLDIEAGVLQRLANNATSSSGIPCTGCISMNLLTQPICEMTCLTECEREILAEIRDQQDVLTTYNMEISYVFNNENWICRAVDSGLLTRLALVPDGAPIDIYGTALLVSMLTLVGGVATITPLNIVEYFYFFAAILSGTILFAAVQGIICGVVTTGDPDEIQWRQQNDSLNFMMEDCKMDQEMRVNVRMYFRRAKKMLKRRAYEVLIDNTLSTELQGDVRYYISANFFKQVKWLSEVDRNFLEDLSIKIKRFAYAKKEEIPADEYLMVLGAGVASRAGAFLTAGSYWGDIIISSVRLRDTRKATAVTYCEIGAISRYDLMDVAKKFPKAEEILKYEGLRLALERAMIVISVYAKTHKEARARSKAAQEKAAAEGRPQEDAKELMDPANALKYVLHPHPDETWQEPEGLQTPEMDPHEQVLVRRDQAFLDEYSKTPSDQQSVELARMMLDLSRKVEHLQEGVVILTGGQYGESFRAPPKTNGGSSFRGAAIFPALQPLEA